MYLNPLFKQEVLQGPPWWIPLSLYPHGNRLFKQKLANQYWIPVPSGNKSIKASGWLTGPETIKCVASHVTWWGHKGGLMQERCNSIANALELHISCTNPLTTFLIYEFILNKRTLSVPASFWNQPIPGEISQYHSYWHSGSLCCQCISNYVIYYAGYSQSQLQEITENTNIWFCFTK